ncbi:hypothetical protein [Tenacibaculum ovolyticum]|uniref:hypothetical protein n=1 Tax=Tenacibaculum ovolyticum TaxID=104270 RepID=UPI0007EC6F34|nr:hypothetical protein [Tenacibaculum ovolyticum]
MISIYILFLSFLSFILLIILFLTRKKGIKVKKIILIIFYFVAIIGVVFLTYSWNSTKDYQDLKFQNFTFFRILNIYNKPVKNITISDLNNSEIIFDIDSSGLTTFYNINNKSIIIKAKGYSNDTILLSNSPDTIYLKPISKIRLPNNSLKKVK